ncbi:hypothetical protein ACFY0R_08265 [Streptomyces sp. NPDC001633]|uniref:hypothetical protein n=1 Tax=Streptomyces sp. NPDC001633 TaxID=3364595 RepID=UPI00367E4632
MNPERAGAGYVHRAARLSLLCSLQSPLLPFLGAEDVRADQSRVLAPEQQRLAHGEAGQRRRPYLPAPEGRAHVGRTVTARPGK